MTEAPQPLRSTPSRQLTWRPWLFAAIAFGLIFLVIGTSSSFQQCIQKRESDKGYEALHQGGAVIGSLVVPAVSLVSVCAGDWADENEGAIGTLSTGLIAIFTFTLWDATRRLWRSAENQLAEFRRSLDQARAIADQQADHMRNSVNEAARAASAMEQVATSISASAQVTAEMAKNQREFWQRQMRAYLSVNYGAVVPQDNTTGWRTEVRLVVVNTGHTPAHEVMYQANADVLPVPLPEDFDFPIPPYPPASASVIGPGQNFIMSCPLKHLLLDEEVAEYTTGNKTRVYMWGIVTYKDVLGAAQTVKFCQFIQWMRGGATQGINTRRHNEAT